MRLGPFLSKMEGVEGGMFTETAEILAALGSGGCCAGTSGGGSWASTSIDYRWGYQCGNECSFI